MNWRWKITKTTTAGMTSTTAPARIEPNGFAARQAVGAHDQHVERDHEQLEGQYQDQQHRVEHHAGPTKTELGQGIAGQQADDEGRQSTLFRSPPPDKEMKIRILDLDCAR